MPAHMDLAFFRPDSLALARSTPHDRCVPIAPSYEQCVPVPASALQSALIRFKPALEALVGEMAKLHRSFEPAPDGILRSYSMCKYTAIGLGHLLAGAGFEVRLVNVNLPGKFYYPMADHQYLLVGDLSAANVVDAAYYQYLRVLSLPKDVAPKEDILVASALNLAETARHFVNLRKLSPCTELRVHYFHEDDLFSHNVYWNDGELFEYFSNVWNPFGAESVVSEAEYFAAELNAYRAGTLSRMSVAPFVLDQLVLDQRVLNKQSAAGLPDG